MVKTIKEGKHYPGWDINLPWAGSQSIGRDIAFHENCKYQSTAYNAQDVNKLFGLSFGFGGVHHNSARFGWRWSNSNECIELLPYVYNEGQRNWDKQLRFPVIAQVKLGETVNCSIVYHDTGHVTFLVKGENLPEHWGEAVLPVGMPHYGLTHGLYWGGKTLCPHTMSVDISRV